MPEINGVGFGDQSQDKQDDFRHVLRLHLDLVEHITERWSQRRYTFIDINAGPGQYEGITGSPLIFLEESRKSKLHCEATFIEKGQVNANALRYLIGNGGKVINDDHTNVLRGYRNASQVGLGLIYHDPSGVIPSFDLLSEISHYPAFKRTDILIYLSATNIKRVRLAGQNETRRLDEYLKAIEKCAWIVRKPQGKHQWTFVIGSNWDRFPDWKKRGFYNMFSPEGQNILDRLTYTEAELSSLNGQQIFADFFN